MPTFHVSDPFVGGQLVNAFLPKHLVDHVPTAEFAVVIGIRGAVPPGLSAVFRVWVSGIAKQHQEWLERHVLAQALNDFLDFFNILKRSEICWGVEKLHRGSTVGRLWVRHGNRQNSTIALCLQLFDEITIILQVYRLISSKFPKFLVKKTPKSKTNKKFGTKLIDGHFDIMRQQFQGGLIRILMNNEYKIRSIILLRPNQSSGGAFFRDSQINRKPVRVLTVFDPNLTAFDQHLICGHAENLTVFYFRFFHNEFQYIVPHVNVSSRPR